MRSFVFRCVLELSCRIITRLCLGFVVDSKLVLWLGRRISFSLKSRVELSEC